MRAKNTLGSTSRAVNAELPGFHESQACGACQTHGSHTRCLSISLNLALCFFKKCYHKDTIGICTWRHTQKKLYQMNVLCRCSYSKMIIFYSLVSSSCTLSCFEKRCLQQDRFASKTGKPLPASKNVSRALSHIIAKKTPNSNLPQAEEENRFTHHICEHNYSFFCLPLPSPYYTWPSLSHSCSFFSVITKDFVFLASKQRKFSTSQTYLP